MNNHFSDIKEAIEHIEVPYDKLDNTIDIAITRAQTLHKKQKRKLIPLIGVASIATCVLISSAFVSPAMAKVLSSIPVLNSVFEFVGDRGLEIASQKGLTNKIEQTETDQNRSVTIKDIFFDGTRLSISYIQEFTSNKDELGELKLKVDGKEINFADSRKGKILLDNRYSGVINIKTSEKLPESFDLSIGLNEVGGVKGDWHFKIPVTKSKEEVIRIDSSKTKIYKDIELTVKTVKIGPAGIKLSVDINSTKEKYPLRINNSLLQFNLLNEEGESLTLIDESVSGDVQGSKKVMHIEYLFSPLEESNEFLTVSPILIPNYYEQPSRVEHPINLEELPVTLDQGKMGGIIVTDLKYLEDKTLLFFNVNSDFPYDGHFRYNTLWLEDSEGTILTSDSKGYPEKINQNSYVQEFVKINNNVPLKVVTIKMPDIEILEEMEIKIPLR